MIDFSLSNCLNSQIEDIAVLTGYQRSYLGSYLKRWHLTNAEDKNISILEPKSGMYLGTADAVYQNLNRVTNSKADTVVILAADHVYRMDYREMIAFHKAMKADVTVGVVSVPIERASQFGTVMTDTNNRIIDFVEKPVHPQSNLVSMGIYVFEATILRERLKEDAAQPESVHDFGRVILPQMLQRDRMFAYKFSGYWQDIGTPEAYHKANLDLVSQSSALSLDNAWPIYPCDRDYRPINVRQNSHVRSSLIGSGCAIKGYVENSIISPGVWVGEGAVVKNSVIMANVSIGRHTEVSHSVVDEGVVIGEHCNVGSGPDFYHGLARVTVLGQNTRVPSRSDIGISGELLSIPKSAMSSGFNNLPEPAMS